jgi:acetolactate synthase small subunit
MSSSEAAVAEAVSESRSRFSVHARAEPGVMPRLLELFAKRGLVPDCWHSVVASSKAGLTIDIEVDGMAHDTVDYVAACMRQITGVEVVLAT